MAEAEAEQVFRAIKGAEPEKAELPAVLGAIHAAKIVGISTLPTDEGVKVRLALEGGVYVDVAKGWPGQRPGSGVDGPRIGGYYVVDVETDESWYQTELAGAATVPVAENASASDDPAAQAAPAVAAAAEPPTEPEAAN